MQMVRPITGNEDRNWTAETAMTSDKTPPPTRLPRAHEGPDYTQDDIIRIRRALEAYKKDRKIRGWPTVCVKINQHYKGKDVESTTEPMNLKTLQRFARGHNVRPPVLKLIEGFTEAKAPIDNIESLGDAAATLFGEMFGNLGTGVALDTELASKFVGCYDVFLEGQALTRNPDTEVIETEDGGTLLGDFWMPKYPDREYVWDQPFEIPYSRVFLTAVAWSGWLQVNEKTRNPEMENADEAWTGGEVSKGILTIADMSDRYVMILKGTDSHRAKIYMLEPDQNSWGRPTGEQRFIGAVIAYAGEKYLSTIGARRVLFVPADSEPIKAAD